MKNIYILFLILFIPFCKTLREDKPDRIIVTESFDPKNVLYVFDAEKDFVKHGFFEKDEKITKSGKYSYKWAKQDQNTYIDLTSFLSEPDENGYRDFSNFDSIYINIYSEEKTSSTFIIALNCQPLDNGKNAYFYYCNYEF